MVLREKWFRTLIHNISDIVALIDAEGLLRFVNPRMEIALGYKSADVLGRNIFDFIHPEDIPRATLEYSETLQRQGKVSLQCCGFATLLEHGCLLRSLPITN